MPSYRPIPDTRTILAVKLGDLTTPALVADVNLLTANLDKMSAALPGQRLRPHVKAHKTSAIARLQAERGHRGFTCATVREVEVMAAAGLGEDLLLANQTADYGRLAAVSGARVTAAVDSEATIDAAAAAGMREVLIDVDIGTPRCGCDPDEAGALAERARSLGLVVRGVMGYEGHAVHILDRDQRAETTTTATDLLLKAHGDVGGDVISGGGTGTYDLNSVCTEIQAGSYVLMDGEYGELDLPFAAGLHIESTVISVSKKGWAVGDCGLKALGMDAGTPTVEGHEVFYYSDEHVTFIPSSPVRYGDRIKVRPRHIDPTIARHQTMYLADGDDVIDAWPVDMRGW